MNRAKFNAFIASIKAARKKMPDEDSLDIMDFFPVWAVGMRYDIDDKVRHNSELYKVVQAHTSQADWTPDNTPALFTEIAKPGEIPVWRQPTGTQDAYNKGDRVHYPSESDPVYESTVDNNVWAPNVYGWELVTNEQIHT